MNALVVCRAGGLRSAEMVVLFGCKQVCECCWWEAEGLPGSAWPARWRSEVFVISCWVEMPV
jgi:hypothetical protein